jgi:hypothetical protein
MSMKRSQRGAIRVSIIWLVVFLVLFFVGCFLAYSAYGEAAAARTEADNARKATEAAKTAEAEATKKVVELSRAVGWYDVNVASSRTDLNAMKAGFDDFRAAFPDMGADVKTLADALPKAKEAYGQRQRDIALLTDAKSAVESEKSTLEAGLRAASQQKDEEIANLRRQMADEANNATQRQTELESRVAALNTQRTELDSQLRDARNQIEANRRQFEQDKQAWETRTRSVAKALRFQNSPEEPDGKILSVSKDLAVAWIDVGANQRLARGTRFRVVDGGTGSTRLKGWAEVTQVKPSMAEVVLYDVVDRFDPIVSGDIVYNPLYDPKTERNAVLCGRFSGQFNETDLKLLLSNMAIKVQPSLNADTDYLIVGSELYIDENGQPLENPLSPTELPVYKEADSQGVQMVSIKQLREYFKF